MICQCFLLTEFTFPVQEVPVEQDAATVREDEVLNISNAPTTILPSLLAFSRDTLESKWCAVVFEKKLYPGIITNIRENQLEIKVMQPVGENRFR